MPISICDVNLSIQIIALVLSSMALLLAWFDKQKASIIALALAVICQGILTLRPSCAVILDPRGVPVLGRPAH